MADNLQGEFIIIMKKLIFGLIATVMFGFQGNSQTKSLSSDSFFELIIQESSNVIGENVLYVTTDYNSKERSYSNYKFEIKEPNFFVLESQSSYSSKKYQVSCTKGGKTLWTKECDGKFSCGGLLYDCLEGGGCGTICSQRLVYVPQTKNLVLLNE